MKKLAWGLLAGMLGVVLLLAVLLARFDGESIKQHLAAELARQQQRALHIDGAMRLELFPRPALVTSGIRLSSSASSASFLTIEEFRGGVELLPLAWGEVVLNRLELRGVDLQLERFPDGRTNYDDFLSLDEGAKLPFALDVDRLTLLGGRINWRDGGTGQAWRIDELYLRAGHVGSQSQGKLEMGGRLITGAGRQLSGNLDALYRIDGKAGVVLLENPSARLKGNPYGLEQARIDIKGRSIRGDIQHLVAELQNIELQGEGQLLAQPVQLRMHIPRLSWGVAGGKCDALEMQVSALPEANEARLHLELVGLQGDAKGLVVEHLKLQGAWQDGDTRLQGQVASAANYDIQAGRLRFSGVQGEIEAKHGEWLRKPLKMALRGIGEVSPGRGTGRGEVSVSLDQSQLESTWRVEQIKPLRLVVDGRLNGLNLDDYVTWPNPLLKSGEGEAAKTETPVSPASEMASAEVQGRLRSARLQYRQLPLDKFDGQFRYRQGHLEVLQWGGYLHGGTIRGALDWWPETHQIHLRQQFRNVEMAPLSAALFGSERLAGRGEGQLDLRAGTARGSLLGATLEGSVALRVRKGAFRGLDLLGEMRRAGAAQMVVPLVETQGQTDFADFQSSWQIHRGQARNQDLHVTAPFFQLTGQGLVDLAGAQMDYQAMVHVVKAPKSKQPVVPAQFQGGSFPLQIRGAFDSLRYELDLARSPVSRHSPATESGDAGGMGGGSQHTGGKVSTVFREFFK